DARLDAQADSGGGVQIRLSAALDRRRRTAKCELQPVQCRPWLHVLGFVKMRQFATSGFRIWNLSLEAKLVYSGFAIFALLALAASLLFYEDMVGPHTAGVRGYYAGETVPPAAPSQPHAVRIDVPEEAQRLTMAVTYRKLLEVTHFHLFTVPVFLL